MPMPGSWSRFSIPKQNVQIKKSGYHFLFVLIYFEMLSTYAIHNANQICEYATLALSLSPSFFLCMCMNKKPFIPHHILFTLKKRTSRVNSVLGIKCKDNADSGMEFLCGYYANNKNHFYEQWKHWTSVVVAVVVVVIVILVEYTAICIKLAHNFVVDFFLILLLHTHTYKYILHTYFGW